MFRRILEFIKHGVWQKKETDIGNARARWALRPFKIILFTVRGIGEHNIIVRSAAMTFYTLMTIVPIAALIFSVVKGFGLETNFNEYIYMQFPQYSAIIDNVLEFANNLLARTRGGIIASVGLVVLLWAVMRLFGNLEKAFNSIWEIKKNRSFARMFSDYVTVIFIAPLLFILSNSVVIYARTSLGSISSPWFADLLFGMISFVAVWLMFTFIYWVIPNTKVKFKAAMTAGIVAGTVFQIYQFAYFYIQSGVSSYNAIYGSFAALPLFLIWLQASWQILLFGAEISFAYQNIGQYEQEREALNMNGDHRRKVLIASMVVVAKHFLRNQGGVDPADVAAELQLPVRIVRDVIFDLENAGLVVAVRNESDDRIVTYIPGRDVHDMKIMDITDAVEECGSSTIPLDGNREFESVCLAVDRIKELSYGSDDNVYITDLIEEEQKP